MSLIDQLRHMADALERAEDERFTPLEDCDLAEACRTLKAALPHKYLCIGFNLGGFSDEPEITWRVYDGTNHHEAKTLVGAVNMALAANAPQPADPVRDLQEKLTPVPL